MGSYLSFVWVCKPGRSGVTVPSILTYIQQTDNELGLSIKSTDDDDTCRVGGCRESKEEDM